MRSWVSPIGPWPWSSHDNTESSMIDTGRKMPSNIQYYSRARRPRNTSEDGIRRREIRGSGVIMDRPLHEPALASLADPHPAPAFGLQPPLFRKFQQTDILLSAPGRRLS